MVLMPDVSCTALARRKTVWEKKMRAHYSPVNLVLLGIKHTPQSFQPYLCVSAQSGLDLVLHPYGASLKIFQRHLSFEIFAISQECGQCGIENVFQFID